MLRCSSTSRRPSLPGVSPPDERDDQKTGLPHRCRVVSGVPLHASISALRGNFLECWEWANDQVQLCIWVTDLRVNKATVSQIMRGGRARWRIEHESVQYAQESGRPVRAHFWPRLPGPLGGGCHADEAGLFG